MCLVSVVKESVTGPGHFLGHNQTLELMESEYGYPETADRKTPADWQSSGATDIGQRACEKVRHILETYYPEHINSETDSLIRSRYPIRLEPTDLQGERN